MARYSGVIGCRTNAIEVEPDVYEEDIIEHDATGDILFSPVRWTVGELSQDGVNANHTISVVATEALIQDFSNAVYASWQGRNWSIKTVDYLHPRIRFTLGGVYNG